MADIIGFYAYASQNVAIGASSTLSTAVAMTTRQVRVVANVDCYLAFSAAGPVATTSSTFLPASTVEYFQIRGGEKLAVIQSSASGSLNVTEMGR